MATRWHDPDDTYGNCMPQCARCNLYDQGRQWRFGERLNEHVPGRAQEIMRAAQRERTYEMEELRQMLDSYRARVQREIHRAPAVLNRPPKAKDDTRRMLHADDNNATMRKKIGQQLYMLTGHRAYIYGDDT